jgi:hypothetical protein
MQEELDLIAARAAVVEWTYDVRAKRATFAKALIWFQSAFPPISRESLVREYCASQQAEKLALSRGEIPPKQQPRVANSYIDRMGAGSAQGNADDFTRRNFVKAGYRRGSGQRVPGWPVLK